jgi:hypothetical protein
MIVKLIVMLGKTTAARECFADSDRGTCEFSAHNTKTNTCAIDNRLERFWYR